MPVIYRRHRGNWHDPRLILVVGSLIVMGYLLVQARAAGLAVAVEAEAGIVGGAAHVIAQAGASGGKIVQFGDGATAPVSVATPVPAPVPTQPPTPTPVRTVTPSGWYRPAKSTTWQWQIDGGSVINETTGVAMYDIDMQDAMPTATSTTITWPAAGNYQASVTWPRGVNAGVINRLHAKGAKVICYTDTGAFENYRPDAAYFPGRWGSGNATRVNDANSSLAFLGPPQWANVDVIGGTSEAANGSTFAGEYWLDQRSSAWQYWEPVMISRFKLAKQIGCDGLEGDQNNAYGNDSTFGVTEADSFKLYQEMFRQQHAVGLGALAKNGIELIPQLLNGVSGETSGASKPDGFLNEECNNFSECSPNLKAAATAGYWVGQVEYTENGSTTSFCPADIAAGFMGMLKHLALGTYAVFCWNNQAIP